MSKVHKRGAAEAEMNMTPLIDVTFQLIIFFMLVNNIVKDQTIEMVVPELREPQTREVAEGDRVVVSIAPAIEAQQQRLQNLQQGILDPLRVPGSASAVYVGSTRYPRMQDNTFQLAAIVEALKQAKATNPDGGVSVLLRADAAVYYEDVAVVMQAINAAEIDEVEMVALKPEFSGSGAAPGNGGDDLTTP